MSKRRGISIHTIARRVAATTGVLAAVVTTAGCAHVPGIYTYEGSSQVAKAAAGFDAATFVDGIWQSKVLPTVSGKAVDAATLLDAIAADPTAAGKKYGRTAGTGAAPAFLVKGTGTVTKVDTTAPTGPVTVTVQGESGTPRTLTIVTGPVIAGTALRDAVGFIDFSQFSNQIDYADVATRLNARVKTDVVAKVDKASLTGKTIEFSGAFSLLVPTVVAVVPTTLTVTP